MLLSDIKKQGQVIVDRIVSARAIKQTLESMGMVPGARVQVLQNDGKGPLIIAVKGTKVALGRSMAQKVDTLAVEKEEHSLNSVAGVKRQTKQRETIFRVVARLEGHHTEEKIWEAVKHEDASIGATTVYRSLKLLEEAGLVRVHHFEGKATVYEYLHGHHDHMICLKCGKIVEFNNATIEKMQQEIARSNTFELTQHKMELYGYCRSCNQEE